MRLPISYLIKLHEILYNVQIGLNQRDKEFVSKYKMIYTSVKQQGLTSSPVVEVLNLGFLSCGIPLLPDLAPSPPSRPADR